jgi:DNA polymerase kappa
MLALFTPKAFEFLLGIALGIGTECHPRETPEGSGGRKGVSKSETFKATSDKAYLDAKMTELATEVALECQRLNLKGRMVAVKLKRSTFDVIQRQTTLAGPTNDVKTIVNSALRLMRNENSIGANMTLRLVGARVSQFDHEEQLPEDQKRIDNFLLSPKTASTQTVAPGEETWTCEECARTFPRTQRTEHLDWHVARRLQSLDDAEQSRARFAVSHKGPSKKPRQGDLRSMFFTKK